MSAAVISLARRPDRLARFQASYDASGWSDVIGPVAVSEAVDGTAEVIPYVWSSYTPGTYGCFRSHLALLERALKAGDEMLFVFEDDAVFESDSAGKLRSFLLDVPSHDALWLGGQHFEHELPAVVWRRVAATMHTHAYALSRRMMQALVPQLRYLIGHLDGLYMSLINEFYVPEPMLVGQAAGLSDVSGCRESVRWWNW